MSLAATKGETLKERIKELLGRGLTTMIVANTLGCEHSYVSQQMNDEGFRNEVLALRAARAEGDMRRDEKWNTIEEKALSRAEEMMQWVSRPSELIRIASMANAAKRRAGDLSTATETETSVVQITLPKNASVHFTINSQSQVVDVEGRSMMPMSSKNLQEMVRDNRKRLENTPSDILDVPSPRMVSEGEKKKVKSILEAIGGEDMVPPDVPKVVS